MSHSTRMALFVDANGGSCQKPYHRVTTTMTAAQCHRHLRITTDAPGPTVAGQTRLLDVPRSPTVTSCRALGVTWSTTTRVCNGVRSGRTNDGSTHACGAGDPDDGGLPDLSRGLSGFLGLRRSCRPDCSYAADRDQSRRRGSIPVTMAPWLAAISREALADG